MLKGLRRRAEKLAGVAAVALTFQAPRCFAIVASGRLVWGLRRSFPPLRWRARAKTFFLCARPPVAMETPLPPAVARPLFKLGFCCVSAHTTPLHRQNLSRFTCAGRTRHSSVFHSYVSLAERLIARRTPTPTAVACIRGVSLRRWVGPQCEMNSWWWPRNCQLFHFWQGAPPFLAPAFTQGRPKKEKNIHGSIGDWS